MNSKIGWRCVWILLLSIFTTLTWVVAAAAPYKFIREIAVGGEGGWDYLSIDQASRRLYVSHTSKVVVIDIDTNEVVGEVADTPGVHGFAVAQELGLGFASDGRENKASIVDLKTLKTTSKVDTGQNPDSILYVPGRQEVYTFNGRSDDATVFEAKTGKVVATIPLGGKPEFAVYDPGLGRIFNNIEDKSVVVSIDARTHKVVDTWPIAPGEEASGMAIDTKNHLIFIGCHNKLMVMMDCTNGKVVASVPIGQGVDANCFDPATGLAFASNGDGTVTIAHLDSPTKLTVVQTLNTQAGSRTMTLDPATHRIYLSAAQFEAAAPAAAGGRQRRAMVPGSFKVLVYGPQ
jgi:YVTN family beta-propeller protein